MIVDKNLEFGPLSNKDNDNVDCPTSFKLRFDNTYNSFDVSTLWKGQSVSALQQI